MISFRATIYINIILGVFGLLRWKKLFLLQTHRAASNVKYDTLQNHVGTQRVNATQDIFDNFRPPTIGQLLFDKTWAKMGWSQTQDIRSIIGRRYGQGLHLCLIPFWCKDKNSKSLLSRTITRQPETGGKQSLAPSQLHKCRKGIARTLDGSAENYVLQEQIYNMEPPLGNRKNTTDKGCFS